MNRRILISGLSIMSSLAIMAGATFAFFTDVGTSSNNVFASGTLNMQLSDNNEEDQENVLSTWGLDSDPGDTFTGDLRVTNTGSTPANHIELTFVNAVTNSVIPPGDTATTPLDSVIEITTFTWDADGDGTPETSLLPVTDTNSNGISDLDDLENQVANDFDNLLFGGTQSADHVLRIAGRLHPDLTVNEHQGDQVSMTLTVTMNQDATQ